MDKKVRRRLEKVLQHGRWIIAGALLSMCIAFLVSHALPKIYAATTYLLVSAPGGMTTWDFTLTPTYLPMVDNDAILANAFQHFHLDQAPFNLRLRRFRQKGYLDVRLPKSSRLIEINVRFPDARLAAGIANYIAESAVERNQQANETETTTTLKTLKNRLDQEAAHLSETETSRVALQQRAQMESREAQLETLLDERAQVSKQIESLQLGLPPAAGALKAFEQPLSTKNPRTAELDDKVISDRFLEDSRKKLEVNEADTAENHQSQNAMRDELQRKSAYSAAQSPGEREALEAAKSSLAPIDRRIDGLLSEITQLRGEIERSDQDFQLASEAYENANRKYHDAPLTSLERNVALRQVSAALIPEQPVGPGALVNALLAGVLAIVFLGAGLVGLEILREIRSEWHGRIVEQDSESAGPHSV